MSSQHAAQPKWCAPQQCCTETPCHWEELPNITSSTHTVQTYLFHLEHVLVEMLLQLLVCEVDAELLKVVDLERFEPCGNGTMDANQVL